MIREAVDEQRQSATVVDSFLFKTTAKKWSCENYMQMHNVASTFPRLREATLTLHSYHASTKCTPPQCPVSVIPSPRMNKIFSFSLTYTQSLCVVYYRRQYDPGLPTYSHLGHQRNTTG